MNKQTVRQLWNDMDTQNWDNLPAYFHDDAKISWPNTDEEFTVDEFVRVNREYPGKWAIRVERLIEAGNTIVSVVKVEAPGLSFHAVSFFDFADGKIKALDEYWGVDEEPPEWRVEQGLGKPGKTTAKLRD